MTPLDLYGRARQDRAFRVLKPVVDAHVWLSRRSVRRHRAVHPVDRDLLLEVVDRRTEAEGVVSLRLASGADLPAWQPGCHVDVELPSGECRQYSLCGDPADRTSYRIAVRLAGKASTEIHTSVHVGSKLVVRRPRTAFPLVPGPALFLAGGIGITALLPMHHRTGHPLVYVGRSRASMPFLSELPDARVLEGRREVSTLLEGLHPQTHVYVCGPPAMIDAVRAAWQGPVHYERFSPPPVVAGTPFTVQLGATGPVVEVGADETALTAVRRVLPDVRYSCQQGFCGTCRVPVLGSTVDSMLLCTDRRQAVLDL